MSRQFSILFFLSVMLTGCMKSRSSADPRRGLAAFELNRAPAVQSQIIAMDEDGTQVVDLAATDPDGDELSYSVVSPSHGSLTGDAPRFTYQPEVGFFGEDILTFTVSDGEKRVMRTVLFQVKHVNHAPVTTAQTLSLNEDGSKSWTLSVTDRDKGDVLTYEVVTPPANGMLLGTAPEVTYLPNAGFYGTDTMTWRARDGALNSNVSTVTINVAHVNHPPVTVSGAIALDEDGSKSLMLVGSDRDVGDVLRYAIVTPPSNGSLSGTGPNLVYTPRPGYFGTDSFTFKANDGALDSNVSTISVVISDVNQAPVAVGQSVSVNEDGSVSFILSASDRDVGDTLRYELVSLPARGSVTGSASNLTYRPNAGFYGNDSFTFRANDGVLNSNIATVTITVAHVNHAPVTSSSTVTMLEDSTRGLSLLASDRDVGDMVTYTIVSPPSNGSLSGTAPNLIYTPKTSFNGTDSFSFKVRDAALDSNVSTITINVTAVNYAPQTSNITVVLDQNSSTSVVLPGSDKDPEDSISFVYQTLPTRGEISGTPPNLIYRPYAGFSGSDSMSFKVSDGILSSPLGNVTFVVRALPTPTPTPTSNPSPTPTATPVVTVTPTPTATPAPTPLSAAQYDLNPFHLKGLHHIFHATAEVNSDGSWRSVNGNIAPDVTAPAHQVGRAVIQIAWSIFESALNPANCTGERYNGVGCYNVEPHVDAAIRNYAAAGIRVTLIINQSPEWAVTPECRNSPPQGTAWVYCAPAPAYRNRFFNFAAFIANKYKTVVDSYIIWNEVNSTEWYKSCSGDCALSERTASYAALYNGAYDAIRAIHPGAPVLIPTTSHFDDRLAVPRVLGYPIKLFLPDLHPKLQGRDWRLAHHPYSKTLFSPVFSPDDVVSGVATMGSIGALEGWLAANFPENSKDLYLTEFSFTGNDPAGQSNAVCNTLRAAIGTPSVRQVLFYSWEDNPHEMFNGAPARSGMVYRRPVNPPAYDYRQSWSTFVTSTMSGQLNCGFEHVQDSAKPKILLQRGYNSNSQRGHWISTRPLPAGFTREFSWYVERNPQPGTRPVYECLALPNGNDLTRAHTFPSLSASCEGQTPMGRLGYVYTAPTGTATQALNRCASPGGAADHLVDSRPCESFGWVTEMTLGYGAPGL